MLLTIRKSPVRRRQRQPRGWKRSGDGHEGLSLPPLIAPMTLVCWMLSPRLSTESGAMRSVRTTRPTLYGVDPNPSRKKSKPKPRTSSKSAPRPSQVISTNPVTRPKYGGRERAKICCCIKATVWLKVSAMFFTSVVSDMYWKLGLQSQKKGQDNSWY